MTHKPIAERRNRARPIHAWLAVVATLVLAPMSLAQDSDATVPTSYFGPLPTDIGAIPVYVAPPIEGSSALPADAELALWALEDWSRAAAGPLEFVPTTEEDSALVRVYFAPPGAGQYGEMIPLSVHGRRGAAVFIRPDTDAFGPEIANRARLDEIFRDTIVYLTCLHELGHALGLVHTSEYEDIMYAFGYGGDIVEYFARFRRQLGERIDMARVSGLARGDLAQLRNLYPVQGNER